MTTLSPQTRHGLSGITLAAVLIGMAVVTRQEPLDPTQPAPPPASAGFIPAAYLGQGDAYNCPAFASQADAQAVLRADPSDPNRLDADKDGLACETRPEPKDLVTVPR